MTCSDVSVLFSEYYDGECTAENKAAIHAHLQECIECAEAYSAYKTLFDELKQIPQPDIPGDFHKNLMVAVSRNKQPLFNIRLWAKVSGSAAACFVVLSLLISGIAHFTSGYPAPNSENAYATADDLPQSQLPAITIERAAGSLASAGGMSDLASLNTNTTTMLAAEYYEQFFEINIRADDFAQAINTVNALGGYNLDSQIYHSEFGGNAHFNRRIAVSEYAQAQQTLRDISGTSYESEQVIKRADEVADLRARLAAKDEEVKRLQALLGQSHTMDVLTTVERNLSAVENARDDLRGRLNQIYAVCAEPYITIYLYENPPEPEAMTIEPFSERVSVRFIRSLNNSIRATENIMVWLSGAVIPLALLLAAAVPILVIVRRRRKSHEK